MDKLTGFYLSKYLKNPKRNLFRFSFIFMILGIILSVGILSAGLNLFEGYEQTLKSLLLESFAHITVQKPWNGYLSQEEAQQIQAKLANEKDISSITPSLYYSLMAQHAGKVRSAQLRGYDFALSFPYYRYTPGFQGALAEGEVIVGHYLAKELGLKAGDEISLIYPQLDRITPLGILNSDRSFKIKAIYRSGYYENDRSLVIMGLAELQDFLMLPRTLSQLELRISNADKALAQAEKYYHFLDEEYITIPWEYYAGSLLKLVKMEKWLIFIVFAFLVLIAGFNVISAVLTIIIDKSSEIAVLRSLGASSRTIKRLFAAKVGIAAVMALILGQILGIILSWGVEKQSFYQLKGEVYFVDRLGAHYSPLNFLAVFGVSFILISLCIYLPLKRIDRVQIIDIFRAKV
ncbi:MAG: FtsX-like permease family protein [Candidatus Cloacimonadaceae bacterium]